MSLRYNVSDDVVKSLLGVIGDVADKVGDHFTAEIRRSNPFGALIECGVKSSDSTLNENAKYACSKLGLSY